MSWLRRRSDPLGRPKRDRAQTFLVIVTDKRLLVYKCRLMLGTKTGNLLFAHSLDDFALETRQRHPIMTIGVPVFLVAIALKGNEQMLTFETSGISIRRLRDLADCIAELRPGLPTISALAASQGQDTAQANAVAQQWAPDPSGRHSLRWWDGTAWTSHVSDGTGATVDPL